MTFQALPGWIEAATKTHQDQAVSSLPRYEEVSEEWGLCIEGRGCLKNGQKATSTCEAAAAKEEAGLNWIADAGCQQCRDTQLWGFLYWNGFCSECQCLQSPAWVADATFAAEMGAGSKLFLKDIKILSLSCILYSPNIVLIKKTIP